MSAEETTLASNAPPVTTPAELEPAREHSAAAPCSSCAPKGNEYRPVRSDRGTFLVVVMLPAARATLRGRDVELVDEDDEPGEACDVSLLDVHRLGDRASLTLDQVRAIARGCDPVRGALRTYRKLHPRSRFVALEVVETLHDCGSRFVAGLGYARAVEYSESRAAPGEPSHFRHRFKPRRQVFVVTTTGELAIARRKGSRLRVTSRGIED